MSDEPLKTEPVAELPPTAAPTEPPAEQPAEPTAQPDAATSEPTDPDPSGEITELEHQYIAATMETMRLQDDANKAAKRLKDAKEHQHDLAEQLRDAKAAAGQLEPDEDDDDNDVPDTETYDDEADEPKTTTSAGPNRNGWRAVSVVELKLHEIKGFGRKKRELFREHVPTIGDLEDLREQAGRTNRQLSDLLPKGIGREAADAIEEAQLNWLAANRERFEAGEVEQPAAEAVPAPTAEPLPESAPTPPDQTTSEFVETTAEFIAVDLPASSRLEQLRAAENTPAYPTVKSREIYQDGWRARRENIAPDDGCCWSGGNQQDDWLMGWLAADKIQPEHADPFGLSNIQLAQ